MDDLRRRWPARISFAYAAFLALWLSALIYELVDLQITGELFFLKRDSHPYISDFVNHYKAGLMVLSGDRLNVYDPAVQLAWINRLIAPDKLDKVFYFQYPPFAFALLCPLSVLPMSAAYWMWCLCSVICGVLALRPVLSAGPLATRKDTCLFLIGMLASLPAWLSLRLGQFSFFILALFAVYFRALFNRNHAFGGFALALSTIKFQYAFFLVVPALVLGRWRLIAWAAFVEIMLVVLAGLTVGWQNVLDYPRILLSAETSTAFTGVSASEMVNVRGLIALLLPYVPSLPVTVIAFAGGLLLVLLVWLACARRRGETEVWAVSSTVLILLLASPHTHAQDLLLLALPASLTLPCLSLFSLAGLSRFPARAWSWLFILYPLLSWFLFITRALWQAFHLQMFCLVNLALLGLGLACLRDASGEKPESQSDVQDG